MFLFVNISEILEWFSGCLLTTLYLLGYTQNRKICSPKNALFCSEGLLTQISECSDFSHSISCYRWIFWLVALRCQDVFCVLIWTSNFLLHTEPLIITLTRCFCPFPEDSSFKVLYPRLLPGHPFRSLPYFFPMIPDKSSLFLSFFFFFF